MSKDFSDPKVGGDLNDMAVTGTKVPNDAGKMNTIPSKPRPDQIASDADPNYVGGVDLADAADNQGDIPRVSTRKRILDYYIVLSSSLLEAIPRRQNWLTQVIYSV